METHHDAKLTSAEISQLWLAFQNDSLSICELEYFLETVENQETAELIKKGLDWSKSHVVRLKQIFNEEQWPLPQGFTEEDVDLKTPKLFSDHFMLYYLQQFSLFGMDAYAMSVGLSARKDVYEYFSKCLRESMQLHQEVNRLLLEKGLYIRPPYLTPPQGIEFIKDENFLGGWFGENRALLSTEIAHLYSNIQRNALAQTILTAFGQTASDEKIQQFMLNGKKIAAKQVEIFSALLKESDLPASITWDNQVTTSTVPPFSDKLMMSHALSYMSSNIGYYGTSIASSLRKDLVADYTRLTSEILKFVQQGTKLMIQNQWLEEPPQAVNYVQLAKSGQ